MDTFRLTFHGHITPEDKQRSDYYYVPFDLPAAARSVQISYDVSAKGDSAQPTQGNVIDIGLLDPRGAEFPGGAGFRGWSGTARREFVVGIVDATPGYLPGPLPAGRYQIILGLYHIEASGADYTIEIVADLQPSGEAYHEASLQQRTATPASSSERGFQWLRGDLHSHTHHSDAKGTLEQLVAKARVLGFDFLAVTDHNTISHHAHLPALADNDLVLIPGQEVTTYYGHMNVWGTSRWCDFRCRTAEDMAQVIDLAHANGGICSVNHPKRNGPPWQYGTELLFDSLEVWQSPWPWFNVESLALWDRLLNTGRRLPAVGGSDYHCPAGEDRGLLRLGWPTTWVKARERSVSAVLEAITDGRTSISAMPDGPRIDLRAAVGNVTAEMGSGLAVVPGATVSIEVQVEQGAGWTLRLIADGTVACGEPITTSSATLHFDVVPERYVRAELVGDAPPEIIPPNALPKLDLRVWRWALSNPIYIVQ